jgi:hypothetical protein
MVHAGLARLMKQFDVCPVKPANASTKKAQWVLVLQHNQADTPDMVVVAPFYDPAAMPPVRGMRLAMTVGKRQQVLAVDQLGAVARHDKRGPRGRCAKGSRLDLRRILSSERPEIVGLSWPRQT